MSKLNGHSRRRCNSRVRLRHFIGMAVEVMQPAYAMAAAGLNGAVHPELAAETFGPSPRVHRFIPNGHASSVVEPRFPAKPDPAPVINPPPLRASIRMAYEIIDAMRVVATRTGDGVYGVVFSQPEALDRLWRTCA